MEEVGALLVPALFLPHPPYEELKLHCLTYFPFNPRNRVIFLTGISQVHCLRA